MLRHRLPAAPWPPQSARLGVGGLVLAIYAMRSEPTVPVSQVLPAAAAEQAGALPRPAPAKD